MRAVEPQILLPAPATGPLYHYCIIRRDVPHGVQVAQCIHAAGESAAGTQSLAEDTRAVALHAKDEAELLQIEQTLIQANIPFKAIREPDAPYLGALMAIGLSPQPRTPELKRLLGKLPLLK